MKKLILAVAIVMLLGSSVQANLILNPGYEAGTGSAADNWSGTRQSTPYSPHTGQYYGFNTTEQSVYLTAGAYVLDGWVMTNDGMNGGRVELLGVGEFTIMGTNANFNWVYGSVNLNVPADGNYTVKTYDPWYYYFQNAMFDDLSLTPEPATMALMGLGVVGMLIRRKRR